MVYIIVALQCEAKPLIKTLQLKGNDAERNWGVYETNQAKLIISGIGKVYMAMAVESLMATISKKHLDSSFILNLGMCGAVKSGQFNLGDIVMVNKVVDHGSGRRCFPDMMVRHNFLEAAIETFDMPVTDSSQVSEALVDMECSGFFQAATKYFPLERIASLKIVSDYLDIKNLNSKKIQNLMTDAAPQLRTFIEKLKDIDFQSTSILSLEDQKLLCSISSHLRLTQTYRSKLYTIAQGCLIRTKKDLSMLARFLSVEVASKRKSKELFKELELILNEDVADRN